MSLIVAVGVAWGWHGDPGLVLWSSGSRTRTDSSKYSSSIAPHLLVPREAPCHPSHCNLWGRVL